jgi:hypothetical protein
MELYTKEQVKELLNGQEIKLEGIDPEAIFNEDLGDRELQENYDGFIKQHEYYKSKYNELVPTINKLDDRIEEIKETIISLATASPEALRGGLIKELKKSKKKSNKLKSIAEEYYMKMEEQTTLIKRYQLMNDRKLFMHWQYLKHLGVTEKPWLDWSSQYKDIMI